MVAITQIFLRDPLPATDAFGDVLPGHFHVYAAGMRTFGEMHVEEATHFIQYAVEVPCFEADRGLHGIAVHGIA